MASSADTSTVLVRISGPACKRLDRLSPKLEKDRGGSWSRAHVIEEAIVALEEKINQKPESIG